MKRRASRALCVLSACAGLWACDAAEVPVFSAATAGTAGSAGSAGTAGMAGSAGSGGVVGASSGEGGTSGVDTGAGGGSAGLGGDVAAGGGDTVCHANANDCTDTFFCQTTKTCEDGAQGTCVVKQPFCVDNLKPVCGCDHVTYWNECYAQQSGVNTLVDGACSTGAKTCQGDQDCGMAGATCAHLLPPRVSCGTSADQGTCWVTPADCSMTDDTHRWRSCAPPGPGGGLGPCTTTCEAINAGHPFMPADRGTCP